MHHADHTLLDVATASVTHPFYGDIVALLLIAGVAMLIALAVHTWRENRSKRNRSKRNRFNRRRRRRLFASR